MVHRPAQVVVVASARYRLNTSTISSCSRNTSFLKRVLRIIGDLKSTLKRSEAEGSDDWIDETAMIWRDGDFEINVRAVESTVRITVRRSSKERFAKAPSILVLINPGLHIASKTSRAVYPYSFVGRCTSAQGRESRRCLRSSPGIVSSRSRRAVCRAVSEPKSSSTELAGTN